MAEERCKSCGATTPMDQRQDWSWYTTKDGERIAWCPTCLSNDTGKFAADQQAAKAERFVEYECTSPNCKGLRGDFRRKFIVDLAKKSVPQGPSGPICFQCKKSQKPQV